jgi:hypothetical protein
MCISPLWIFYYFNHITKHCDCKGFFAFMPLAEEFSAFSLIQAFIFCSKSTTKGSPFTGSLDLLI